MKTEQLLYDKWLRFLTINKLHYELPIKIFIGYIHILI